MSTSETYVEGVGKVRIFRRKGLKNLRITVSRDGSLRLSIPWYVPKAAGMAYLHSKKDWIKKYQQETSHEWTDGQVLTKSHRLSLKESPKHHASSSISGGLFCVYVPVFQSGEQKHKTISRQIAKFLKAEGEKQLAPLVLKLAAEHGFKVKAVRIKNMKSRWGSCNQEKIITLNISLMQLPEEISEYVIVHELAHTKHLNHSKDFWMQVEKVLPDYKQRRKSLKRFNRVGIF
ncbi:MAG TPA: SprT family zinc-dependent metalloprotease [Candidatus Saccharimonadales bacterium]|nr:SprT family zinc-dependent metalloprotease [Candidatus Saccharimonadales bacterium]